MLLQIHRHLGGKALSFNIRETFNAERKEKLTREDEVRLAESVVAPRLPKARPTLLIEKRGKQSFHVLTVDNDGAT